MQAVERCRIGVLNINDAQNGATGRDGHAKNRVAVIALDRYLLLDNLPPYE